MFNAMVKHRIFNICQVSNFFEVFRLTEYVGWDDISFKMISIISYCLIEGEFRESKRKCLEDIQRSN